MNYFNEMSLFPSIDSLRTTFTSKTSQRERKTDPYESSFLKRRRRFIGSTDWIEACGSYRRSNESEAHRFSSLTVCDVCVDEYLYANKRQTLICSSYKTIESLQEID